MLLAWSHGSFTGRLVWNDITFTSVGTVSGGGTGTVINDDLAANDTPWRTAAEIYGGFSFLI